MYLLVLAEPLQSSDGECLGGRVQHYVVAELGQT